MNKIISIGIICMISILTLASCTIDDAESVAQKSFNQLCQKEPGVYAALGVFQELGVVKPSAKIDAIHIAIVDSCSSPPTDYVTALVTLARDYATIYNAWHKAAAIPPAPS